MQAYRTYPNIIPYHYGHNNSINSHCFTEDNTDEIFSLDTRGFHSTSYDAGSSCKDTPANKEYMSRHMTKPTKWSVHPAKIQINLGIRPVWSESLLSAWRNTGPLTAYWVHSEDSDQTGRMPRLIWVFAGRTDHFIGFVMMQLIYVQINK